MKIPHSPLIRIIILYTALIGSTTFMNYYESKQALKESQKTYYNEYQKNNWIKYSKTSLKKTTFPQILIPFNYLAEPRRPQKLNN